MREGGWLERLDVVAALPSYDGPLSDPEQGVIRSATRWERALAEGLAGGPEPLSGPDAEAIAGLLRLAIGTDVVSLVRAVLRETFVPADGSRLALAREDRACAFTELFRTCALPGLPGWCPGDGRAAARCPGTVRVIARTVF
jgi:hypothetical protein